MAGVDGSLRKELAFDQIAAHDQNFLFSPLQKVIKRIYLFFNNTDSTSRHYILLLSLFM